MRDGHVVVTTRSWNHRFNYYGNAHGKAISFTPVTSQWAGRGSPGVDLGDPDNSLPKAGVWVMSGHHSECVHSGRTTRVVDVDITNQDGANVCRQPLPCFIAE